MSSNGSLKAAEEAAAKVNAMLVATGQLKHSVFNKGRVKQGKSTDLFVEKVTINDAPISARNYLTRSSTQEEISKMSGASVSTRGRYMNKDEIEKNVSADRPLFLHIQGHNEQDVKVAVGRIMHLIMEHTHRKKSNHERNHQNNSEGSNSTSNCDVQSSGSDGQQTSQENEQSFNTKLMQSTPENAPYSSIMFREKVFLPMTVNMNPVEVRSRLVGENHSNLNYIKNETGASIFMRGIGSGFLEPSLGVESQEALHFYLEHPNEEKFNEAKDLVVNLAQTILSRIHQEQPPPFQFNQALPQPQPQLVTQPVFQPNFPPQIGINGNVPPQPVINPAVAASHSEVQNLPPQGLITHPPPPNLAVQMNPFSVPFIMNPSQQGNAILSHPGQIQDVSQPSLEPTAQLVQISVASAVAGTDIVSQQFVQTSLAPQLVHFSHGPQIVSTLDGPKVINLTPANSSAPSFITQTLPARSTQGSLGVVLSQQSHQSVALPVPQPVIQPLPQPLSQPAPQMVPQPTPQMVPQPLIPAPLAPGSYEQRDSGPRNAAAVDFSYTSRPIGGMERESVNLPVSGQPTSHTSFQDVHQAQVVYTHSSTENRNSIVIQTPISSSLTQHHTGRTDDGVQKTSNTDWGVEVGGQLTSNSQNVNGSMQNTTHSSGRSFDYKTNEEILNPGVSRSSSGEKPSPGYNPWSRYSHDPGNSFGSRTGGPQVASEDVAAGGVSRDENVDQPGSDSLKSSEVLGTLGEYRFSSRKNCGPTDFFSEPKRCRSFGFKGENSSSSQGQMNDQYPKNSSTDSGYGAAGNVPAAMYGSDRRFCSQSFESSGSGFRSNSSSSSYNLPLERSDFGPRNHGTPHRPYTEPPPDRGSSWRARYRHEGWGGHGARPGFHQSPWESGVPGLTPGRNFNPRYNRPFHKPKFPHGRY